MAFTVFVPRPDGSIEAVEVDGDTIDQEDNTLPWVVKKGSNEVARFGAISGYVRRTAKTAGS